MNYIDTLAARIAQNRHDDFATMDEHGQRLYRIYALLGLLKGQDVTLEDVHDAWAVWRAETNPTHQSIKPFVELTPDVQALDQPYVDAIRKAVT